MAGFFNEMTVFFDRMNTSLPFARMLALSVRILVAGICGAGIGFERSRRFKGAGVRTHFVVACTAALLMVISKYGFSDFIGSGGETVLGTKGMDPARIAAQAVSGVSFLGAGIIFRNGTSIKGLTTAAGVWATAGIGLAIGSGMYFPGLFLTALLLAFQFFMYKHTVGTDFVVGELSFTVKNGIKFQDKFKEQMNIWNAEIVSSNMKRKNGMVKYRMLLKVPKNIGFEDIVAFVEENDIVEAFEGRFPY